MLLGGFSALVALALSHGGALAGADAFIQEAFGVEVAGAVPEWVAIGTTVLLALGIAWAVTDIPRGALKTAVAVAALAEAAAASWVLAQHGHWLPPAAPLLAGTLAALLAGLYAQSEGGRRKKELAAVFGRRVSKAGLGRLLDTTSPPHFAGAAVEVTVLACEVVGGVGLEEAEAPAYLARVNRVLDAASEYLVAKGAYLESVRGGQLRAVFGDPVPDAGHAMVACSAAFGMSDALGPALPEDGSLSVCVGLQTGQVFAGLIGGARCAAYGVLGEAAELAGRWAAANLEYGTRVILGAETLAAAGDGISVRPVDRVVGGFPGEEEEIFELLAAGAGLAEDVATRRDAYWRGVVLYREGRFGEALSEFALAASAEKGDPLLERYVGLCRRAGGDAGKSVR